MFRQNQPAKDGVKGYEILRLFAMGPSYIVLL